MADYASDSFGAKVGGAWPSPVNLRGACSGWAGSDRTYRARLFVQNFRVNGPPSHLDPDEDRQSARDDHRVGAPDQLLHSLMAAPLIFVG